MMKKIMFVCHGNICRSPMAEFIMKDLARKAHVSDKLHIESSATSCEEIGNPIYSPAAQILSIHGIGCKGHHARRFTMEDYNNFDLVVVMEDYNLRNMLRIIACDCEGKVWKLLDFTADKPIRTMGEDISDPWYHGNFEKTYNEILAGCQALMRFLGF
ncbi:MAG: low molecular weight phosphotyrosine protein phosphatase [Bacteroidaceae bacterium]|nr:low molecular weight phosphotyrosine protein phosphatase [Bacteroidaceae bacterium]